MIQAQAMNFTTDIVVMIFSVNFTLYMFSIAGMAIVYNIIYVIKEHTYVLFCIKLRVMK